MFMEALVMQLGNNVGTSFFYVCADFGDDSLIRAVINGLDVTRDKLPW